MVLYEFKPPSRDAALPLHLALRPPRSASPLRNAQDQRQDQHHPCC